MPKSSKGPVDPSAALVVANPKRGSSQTDEVTRLIEAAASYPIFNLHNAAVPNSTVPLLTNIATQTIGQLLAVAFNVNEELHRFEVETDVGPHGLTGSNAIGDQAVANVTIRFTPIPDDYIPGPGVSPPPTLLNPFKSQRFTTLDGNLSFRDKHASGVTAFGSGRTFPVGGGSLNIGAAIDVLSGAGTLYGISDGSFPGATMVINGFITPPTAMGLSLLVRIMDPSGALRAKAPVPPLPRTGQMPSGSGTFMLFRGEPDPDRPIELIWANGVPVGAHMFEILRRVEIGFDLDSLESSTEPGEIVGTVSSVLACDFQNANTVTTAQTTGGLFTFFVPKTRKNIGSLSINMLEGRAFRTYLPGAPSPVFRVGGFGPLLGGTGAFVGAQGMMTVNGVISAFPASASNLYVLRLTSGGTLV